MDNPCINHRPRMNIPVPISILFSGRKNAGVVSLLNNHNRNLHRSHARNLSESVFYCCKLLLDNLVKLTSSNAITEVNDFLWKGFIGVLVFKEEACSHLVEFMNDFNAMALIACNRSVTDCKGVERTRQSRKTGLGTRCIRRGMSNVSSKERLNLSKASSRRYNDIGRSDICAKVAQADIDTSQFAVDLHQKICSESFIPALPLDVGTDDALRWYTVQMTETFKWGVKGMKLGRYNDQKEADWPAGSTV